MHDSPVEDEAATKAGSKCEEDEMVEVVTMSTDAKMELCERTRIAVVFDENGKIWKLSGQPLLQPHVVLSEKMRRIEQHALPDLERPADGNAQRYHLSTVGAGSEPDRFDCLDQRRKSSVEWLSCLRCNHFPLQNSAVTGTFDAGNLAAADIEPDHCTRSLIRYHTAHLEPRTMWLNDEMNAPPRDFAAQLTEYRAILGKSPKTRSFPICPQSVV